MNSLTRRYSQDLMKAHAFDKLQEQLNKAQEVSNQPTYLSFDHTDKALKIQKFHLK